MLTPYQAKEIARSMLDNVLNNQMTDSTNIAFDFVNEIVNSSFESTQKPTISGSHVYKSTFENGQRSFHG